MSKVNVYDDNQNVIARVEYNSNLDQWDGKNWSCGSTGRHLGITKLKKSGKYVLIHGTDWQGERDWAWIISPEEAYKKIVESNNEELLEKYPDLKVYEEEIEEEEV